LLLHAAHLRKQRLLVVAREKVMLCQMFEGLIAAAVLVQRRAVRLSIRTRKWTELTELRHSRAGTWDKDMAR
jgi:hypothetical protein